MKTIFKPTILASFLLIIAIFGYFSFNTPLMTDNFVFSRDINPGYADFYTGKQVTVSPLSFQSAFRQACYMYNTWCGRFMGNLVVYLLFLLPSSIYHILSCLAFALYILLLQICIFGRNWREKLTPGWILALAALVWLSIPSFGEAFLWLSVGGQIALLAQICMLLPYRLTLQSPDDRPHVSRYDFIQAPLFLLAGLVTSSLDYPTSASLPGTALAAVVYIYFMQKTRPRKIPWLLLCGALGLIIGAAFTLMAPGNTQRLHLTNDDNVISWLSMSWAERIGQWLLHLPSLIALFPIPLIILIWGLFCLWQIKGKFFYRLIPKSALLFLLPFCLTIGAYLFTAWPPPRAFATCAIQLLLCALIIAEKGSVFARNSLAHKWHVLKLLLIICTILTIAWQVFVFYKLNDEIKIRENIIASTVGDDLLLPPLHVPTNKYQVLGGELQDISEDSDFWVNRAIALHYGFKRVYKASDCKEYTTAQKGLLQDLNLFLKKDRLFIQTENDSLANLLKKEAYIYYYGKPALLSRLWSPLAKKIYAYLAVLNKDDVGLYLIPLLMSWTKLKPLEANTHLYLGQSPIIRLDDAETVWLVQPGEGSTSFNLIPFTDSARKVQSEEKAR